MVQHLVEGLGRQHDLKMLVPVRTRMRRLMLRQVRRPATLQEAWLLATRKAMMIELSMSANNASTNCCKSPSSTPHALCPPLAIFLPPLPPKSSVLLPLYIHNPLRAHQKCTPTQIPQYISLQLHYNFPQTLPSTQCHKVYCNGDHFKPEEGVFMVRRRHESSFRFLGFFTLKLMV